MKFTDEQLRTLLEEHAARKSTMAGVGELRSRIYAELFKQQVDFVEDESKYKSVLGSRRAGKTEMWARYATAAALENPRGLVRIWHSSRLRAKEMLWASLNYLHARHGIHTKTHETELTITFDNGASIKLVGASTDKESQKKRGDKTVLEIMLEVQNFGSYLRSTIDDVIEPSLLDNQGTLCVEGTPGPVCVGAWFEISGDNASARRWVDSKSGRWSNHRWTLLDNPHLPHARKYLAQKKKERNWGDDHPTYLREYCGQWVQDYGSLFYKFDHTRNTYSPHEIQPWGPGWQHSLGWDLGFRDDMALVIWGWHEGDPNLYEVFSWSKSGALAKEVMDVIDTQEREKGLSFVEQVADTGGGGRMYVEELMSRYSRQFKAAKKTEKYEHVRLFNDELYSGRIKLIGGSGLQQEMASLMKDPDWPPPDKPEAPPREDPSMPNHCCFVAGTLVTTRAGQTPIEELEVGVEVLTRKGWRPIAKTAPTGVKPIISKLGLTGTPDHPIWTENRGWVRLDLVRASDTVLSCKSLNNGETQASTISTGHAYNVEKPSGSTSIEKPRYALVYAVSVAECHEYFANGILVSNCDASLYSWRACWHYVEKPKLITKPGRGSEREVLEWLEKAGRMRNNPQDNWGFGASDEDS